MIYLRTGANGTCKTLFTLADVRKLQLETGRPVCINKRFKMNEAKRLEFGWTVIDFKDWQAQQDGTIFLIDECHNDMPVRASSAAVPDEVRMLAEHRSRGFDFFLLTQHPMNIDGFVRKLIGAPGWHQHLKRVFGGTRSTRVLQWDAVNTNCEKDGSGKNAQITTRMQPREVYSWYDSATLHTAKVRIPIKVWFLLAGVVLIIVLGWFAWQNISARGKAPATAAPTKSVQAQPGYTPVSQAQADAALTPAQYVATFMPRLEGLPYTAPRYDEVTKPTTAPYPAACVSMGDKCKCYSQQGTLLATDKPLCLQIVANGFFQDWQDGTGSNQSPVNHQPEKSEKPWAGNPGSHPSVAMVTKGDQIAAASHSDGEVLAAIRPGGYYRQQRN